MGFLVDFFLGQDFSPKIRLLHPVGTEIVNASLFSPQNVVAKYIGKRKGKDIPSYTDKSLYPYP